MRSGSYWSNSTITTNVSQWIWFGALLLLASISYWPNVDRAANHVAGDTPGYLVCSWNFAHGVGLVDQFNGEKYPPEHSFGLRKNLNQ